MAYRLRQGFWDIMLADLRFAFRQLLKNPGFTAVAVFRVDLNTPSWSTSQRSTIRGAANGVVMNAQHSTPKFQRRVLDVFPSNS